MRAKSKSRRMKFVCCGGSTWLITSWTIERAWEAAYWRALNQVVKRSLMAVNLAVSKSLLESALNKYRRSFLSCRQHRARYLGQRRDWGYRNNPGY